MEAASAGLARRVTRPAWLTALLPLVVLGAAIAVFVALDAPGLDRRGVPVEEIVIERTILHPGTIELQIRNDGPDPIEVGQVIVNGGFVSFAHTEASLDRFEGGAIRIPYPWIEGQAYEVELLTSTGGLVPSTIEAATETPQSGGNFFALMALIGFYVGVVPVGIGMLWLPWVRRIGASLLQFLLALTVGILGFLAIDAVLEGAEIAGTGAQSLGGSALVYLGAVVAFLALTGVDAGLRARSRKAEEAGDAGFRLALLVAIGIGMHNLGEGLAIGSAHAIGSLALGASLIVGFALHNTTEGLAIVAPVASVPPRLRRLALLGLVGGAPTILGAWIGAAAFNSSLAAFMLGLGTGAIAQVAVQLAPTIRNRAGQLLHPLAVGGLLSGLALMYATGLLIPL